MKGKRKKEVEEDHLEWKDKEKKEEEETKLTKPSEKKKKGQKLRLDSDHGTLSVGLITKMPLKTKLWKLKTPKMCF